MPGTFYQDTLAGNVFIAASPVAGNIIPVQATNLVSTFTVWNPVSSGVNLELIRYTVSWTTTVEVVGDVGLYAQFQVGSAVTVPGTLTSRTIRNGLLGSGKASQASYYTAATLVSTTDTNLFRMATLAGPGAVTSTNNSAINYSFDGMMIVPPGALVVTAGFAAQTAATDQTLVWREVPI